MNVFVVLFAVLLSLVACTDVAPQISMLTSTVGKGSLFFQNTTIQDNKRYVNSQNVNTLLAGFDKLNELAIGEGNSCDSLSWGPMNHSVALTLSAGDGVKNIYYKARKDKVEFSCQSESIILDTTPPTLNSSQPVLGAVNTSDTTHTPTLSWSAATDTGSGVKQYELSLGTAAGLTDLSDWVSQGLNLSGQLSTTLPQGPTLFLNFRAVDQVGNTSSPATISFSLGRAPPVLTLSQPTSSPSNSSNVRVTVSGVQINDTINFFSDENCTLLFNSLPANSSSFPVDMPSLSADGAYQYYANLDDGTNTSPCSAGLTYIRDTVTPTLSVTTPTNLIGNTDSTFSWVVDYTGADFVSLNVSDITLTGSGSLGCSASVTGTGVSTRTIAVTGCSGDGNLGISIASATAADSAGNTSLSYSSTPNIIIDNTAPTLSIVAPSPQAGSSTTTFVWRAVYAGADNISLNPAMINFLGPGSVGCSASISTASATERNIVVTGCTGSGAVYLNIPVGSANDLAGNNSNAIGNSLPVSLDQKVYTVQFSTPGDSIPEGNNAHTQTIEVSISPTPTQNVDVYYSINQLFTTATYPADHNLTSSHVTILPGQTSTQISYTYNGNASANPSRVLLLELSKVSGPASWMFGPNFNFRRMVVDDESTIIYTKISTGSEHACAITNTGVLKCWGNNSYSQLGDGTTAPRTSPVTIDSGVSYSHVSAGVSHTCGITSTNVLKCWGYNGSGQIGSGDYSTKSTPVVVDSLSSYSRVSAGSNYTCGITSLGVLKCWGNNASGQLGDGSFATGPSPWPITGDTYSEVSTGINSTCAVTTGKKIKCWGKNSESQLGLGNNTDFNTPQSVDPTEDYEFIEMGYFHACGRTSSGSVKCWGSNTTKEIGDSTSTNRNIPTLADLGTPYISIATARQFTCGVTSANKVRCWGNNNNLQLGLGYNTTYGTLPSDIDPATSYSSISAFNDFTCGITTSGDVKCWGLNTIGQLADGGTPTKNNFVTLANSMTFKDLTAGQFHVCGIKTSGELMCWGDNANSQLGDLSSNAKSVPQFIDKGVSFERVSAGVNHNCAITQEGLLKCWGNNSTGQLGLGTTQGASFPKAADSSNAYTQVSAGANHSCGITVANELRCWGVNSWGQLGDGTTNMRTSPVTIDPGTSYNMVSTGQNHTCAITTSNILKCWGANGTGQLGDGTFDSSAHPTPQVVDSVPYSFVKSGNGHTCGITVSGELRCWGKNSNSQLGDGTSVNKFNPTTIDPGVQYQHISTNEYNTCAVTNTKVLKCWGTNGNGQLGTDSVSTSNTPRIVLSGTSFKKVVSGFSSTCALTEANTILCWGSNSYGELGNGRNFLPAPIIK